MTESNMESTRPASHKSQYIAALSACMGGMAIGCVMGYSSPAGPLLMVDASPENLTQETPTANNTLEDLHLTPSEYGWFSSTANIGAVIGGFLGGLAAKHWGRRTTMLLSALPFILGWILIALTQNMALLLVGRILTGACMGATSTAAPPYIAEMASPHLRGVLGSAFQVMMTGGTLYAFILGALLEDWRWLAAMCTLPPALYFLLMYRAKESPVFLLSQGKDQEAHEAMVHFRGKLYNIEREMDIMKQSLKKAKENPLSLTELSKAEIMRPLLISLSLMFFQEFSGSPAVVYNLTSIFKASGIHLAGELCSIIVGVVQVLATVCGALLMDKAGRKMLLIISASCMMLSIGALGGYFYMRELWPQWTAAELSWLPLTSLIIFISTFSIGFGPVPWVIMGELFPENAREFAASLTTAMNWSSAFIVTLIFYPLKMLVGDYGVYWIFGSICSIALLFSITVVPETKGKTLQEITQYFERSTDVVDSTLPGPAEGTGNMGSRPGRQC